MILIDKPAVCERECGCTHAPGSGTKLVVVTGGPSAGKTAILEIARKELCEHVALIPEAASIVFGGGFWRLSSDSARRASQRAILHIQKEMEALVIGEGKWAIGLCDRGLLDGLAYWPGDEAEFWAAAESSLEAEYARYHAVIHLRTPDEAYGYNNENPLRTENAAEAIAIDQRIAHAWSGHPNYTPIDSSPDFIYKVETAMKHITMHLPDCCLNGLGMAKTGK